MKPTRTITVPNPMHGLWPVIEYRNAKGQLHRENGPARILANGTQYWYQNGGHNLNTGSASGTVVITSNGSYGYFNQKSGQKVLVYHDGKIEKFTGEGSIP